MYISRMVLEACRLRKVNNNKIVRRHSRNDYIIVNYF